MTNSREETNDSDIVIIRYEKRKELHPGKMILQTTIAPEGLRWIPVGEDAGRIECQWQHSDMKKEILSLRTFDGLWLVMTVSRAQLIRKEGCFFSLQQFEE